MSDANVPFSGAVSQCFRYWQSVVSTLNGQLGLINVNVVKASDPAVEEKILTNVASYGKQLGRLQDGLIVMLNHLELGELEDHEVRAIYELAQLLNDIADVKQSHYQQDHYEKRPLRPKIQIALRS
ncbi:hypothetical protein [Bradyrhizobium sp. STM 3562]|uniref:hypothetical protein n=1 Tax=Bradyrhizobium sp. STM 3562 TaxID=578924 RepID=UPI00388DC7CB